MPISRSTAEGLARAVADSYAEAERLMLARIARNLAKGADAPDWATKKLAQIRAYKAETEALIAALQREAATGVQEALAEAYRRGGLAAVNDIASAQLADRAKYGVVEWSQYPSRPWVIREANGTVLHRFNTAEDAFAYVDRHAAAYAWAVGPNAEPLAGLKAVEALTSEVLGNLSATSARILRVTQDAYRDAVARGAEQVLLGTSTRIQGAQQVLDELAKRGITGFIDSAGRGWSLESYAEMAVRSGTMRASLAGHMDTLQENGLDLVIVSANGSPCPLCQPWEGEVLSISGDTPGYQTVTDCESAGWGHPGCRHTMSAYQEGITRPYPEKSEADIADEAERYVDNQKLRYIERQIRASKRMEAVAMTPEAQAKAAARVKTYQAQARAHVAATDAVRQYPREQIGQAH